MTVTRIEPLTKIKFKIYLDGSFAFVLYKGELSRFGITAGAEISEETVERIRKEVIFKRARLRAMHLLEDMDRTEAGASGSLSGGCVRRRDPVCKVFRISGRCQIRGEFCAEQAGQQKPEGDPGTSA